MTGPQDRTSQLAGFYASHHRQLQRIVAFQVSTTGTILEDACQTASIALWTHHEFQLHDEKSALAWLTTTAIRDVWKRSSRGARERPVGGFLPATTDASPLELPEPVGESPDPCELVIAHEEHHQRVEQLRALTDRERLYLYLQAAGYSYRESAQLTDASRRTVEKQILRAHRKLKVRSQRG